MNGPETVRARLRAKADPGYREFQSALMPTVPPERVLGVRQPDVRALAKELSGTQTGEEFLQALPHYYYEEQNLHGALIERMAEPDLWEALDRFLPTVDNWATCDMLHPPLFKKRPPQLLGKVRVWLTSGDLYTVRFAVGVLMRDYLGEGFEPWMPEAVAALPEEEYYLNMMAAWYCATALSVRPKEILPYFTGAGRLRPEVRHAALQKAVESRRFTPEEKEQLKELRETLR